MRKFNRIVLIWVNAINALTAIGGGIAIIKGADKFPLEWLEGSPFSSYTIPALILIFIVGGSSLFSVIALFIRQKMRYQISMLAGFIMMIFITTEFLILKQDPPGPTLIEFIYFLSGMLVLGLSNASRYSRIR